MNNYLLNIVGLGPGDPDLITLKALKTLKASDFVFYPRVLYSNNNFALDILKANLIDICDSKLIPLDIEMKKNFNLNKTLYDENALKIFQKLRKNYICSYITIGDPVFYSTYTELSKSLKQLADNSDAALNINIISGISSFNYLLSLIKEPYVIKKSSVLITVPIDKTDLELESEINFINFAKNKPSMIIYMKAGNFVYKLLDIYKRMLYSDFKNDKLKFYLLEKSALKDCINLDSYLQSDTRCAYDYFSILAAIFI
jgi:precorrin-2/cobalt-factor-2 C20-methyltransferase